ncbi:MAG: helix-turn-helix transcriptional regulator [Flavobacterium sp.]|uniref:helix-turn-helix transcriptional regulator n=1 Tax=Flavobacterium sp. TaxID=239 RepID=UPI002B4A782D|nr:helix-turn-helix transcriptional regulator [Flavobacterium sp.]WRH74200.1 MAG: helix-turn-helix transcriptional regulator [Flavobacterium sp.]
MQEADKRILKLIDLLIFEKKIKNQKDFCSEVGLLLPNLSKIKKGESRFRVSHIEVISKKYNVNINWIFGTENKVFRTPESIEITSI